MNRFLVRLLVLLTVLLGVNYLVWRWLESLNWSAWWIAVPLVLAETCVLISIMILGPAIRRSRGRTDPEIPPPSSAVSAVVTGCEEPADTAGATFLAPRDVKAALARTRAALKEARRVPEAADPVVAAMLDDVEAAARRARADLRAGTPLTELIDRWKHDVDAAARRTVSRDFDQIQSDLAVIAAIDLPPEDEMVWPEELASAVERMSQHDLSPLASIEPVQELLEAVDVDRRPDAPDALRHPSSRSLRSTIRRSCWVARGLPAWHGQGNNFHRFTVRSRRGRLRPPAPEEDSR